MSELNISKNLILNSNIVIGQEIKTGTTYAGKPVYIKAVECHYSNTTGSDNATPHGITNIWEIIDIKGFSSSGTPTWSAINYYTPNHYSVCVVDRTNVLLNTTNAGLKGRSAIVFITYVKNN